MSASSMASTSAISPESFAMDTLGPRQRPNAQTGAPTSVPSETGAVTIEEEPGPIRRARKEWKDIQHELPPQITRRNIQMISVGGVIGTGLFLGISTSLSSGGPIGMVIGYIITGTIVYAVVISLSEMVSYIPNVGGPIGLADLYVDRALGFAMGWNAWYQWTIVLPAELSAAVVIASYYLGDRPSDAIGQHAYDHSLIILNYTATTLLLVGAVGINCMTRYGQYEYYFATIKVCTIVVLIILGIVLNNISLSRTSIVPPSIVNFTETDSGNIGFRNLAQCIADTFGNETLIGNDTKTNIGFKYYYCPGPFVQFQGIPGTKGKVLGIWSVLMQSIFSYCGSEIPGLAGAEVENPTKNIPSAVKRTWVRIFLFYVLGVFVAGLLVPYNHAGLVTSSSPTGTQFVQSSPFIIAMEAAGWKNVSRIVTVFFLMSAWSAATSDIYISSRFMFFLAKRGHAPKFLSTLIPVGYAKEKPGRRRFESASDTHTPTTPARGARLVIPIFGVLMAMLFAVLAYLPAQSPASNAQQVFLYVTTMTSAAAMLSWISIMVTYRISWAEECDKEFKKKNPALYENRSFMQPYLAWYAVIMCIGIIILHGWAVFTLGAVRRIALEQGDEPPPTDFVFIFITSYLPIPLFLLAIFGYKLVNQTSFVELHEMDFDRGKLPEEIKEEPPRNWLEWLF